MNINTQTIARQTVCPGRLQFHIFLFVSSCCFFFFFSFFSFFVLYYIYIFFLSLSEEVFLTAVCAFERQTKFVKSWVFPFAFSASTFFLCREKRLNYLTRMRRGSNNRETPKRVPSSKNNRQLVTCRPFRDSCMRTKPNSYRHGSYRLGRVYRQGSKTLFHAYGPWSSTAFSLTIAQSHSLTVNSLQHDDSTVPLSNRQQPSAWR